MFQWMFLQTQDPFPYSLLYYNKCKPMGFPRSQGFMRHAFSEYRRIILPRELDKKNLVRPPETVFSYTLNLKRGWAPLLGGEKPSERG